MSSCSEDDELNYHDFDESDLPHRTLDKQSSNSKKLSPLLFNCDDSKNLTMHLNNNQLINPSTSNMYNVLKVES